jgi:hypothetical protein
MWWQQASRVNLTLAPRGMLLLGFRSTFDLQMTGEKLRRRYQM